MKKIKKLLKKQGFTLVELIIVIAIIAVLAVAAFMMLTKWLGKSRDSRRISDLGTIKKALEVTYSDTDRGLNMYPNPTDSEDVTDMSGAVMWHQGIFGLDTIGEMDNMQKAPQDPGDQSYYKYSITLDKKEFQLGTVLEDGSDVSVIGSVLAANGEARIDGNYDGYVSYPTTGGTMILKTPSLLINGEPTIASLSGITDKFIVNGEEEGAEIYLRSIKTDENTSAEQVATALGIDAKSAAIVLKKETGAVVTVVEDEQEDTTPSLDDNTPNNFSFTDLENLDTNSAGESSNIVQINGINIETQVSISGDGVPNFRICEDSACSSVVRGYDGVTANITNGQYLQLLAATSSSNSDTYTVVLNVGTVSVNWNLTTIDNTSCQTLVDGGKDSGVYTIDPDGDGTITPFDTYCYKDSDGSGWTLVATLDRSGLAGNNWLYQETNISNLARITSIQDASVGTEILQALQPTEFRWHPGGTTNNLNMSKYFYMKPNYTIDYTKLFVSGGQTANQSNANATAHTWYWTNNGGTNKRVGRTRMIPSYLMYYRDGTGCGGNPCGLFDFDLYGTGSGHIANWSRNGENWGSYLGLFDVFYSFGCNQNTADSYLDEDFLLAATGKLCNNGTQLTSHYAGVAAGLGIFVR